MPRQRQNKEKKGDGENRPADFTLFSKLPAEIQTKIWEHCLPARRILGIQVNPYNPQVADCDRRMLREHRYLPRLARVCRNAHRVALEQFRQRQPYTIADVRQVVETQPGQQSRGVDHRVLFNPGTDVLFVNDIAGIRGRLANYTSGSVIRNEPDGTPPPRLITLLQDPSVDLCVSTFVALNRTRFLRDLAQYGRQSFYLALGDELLMHMSRVQARENELFGFGADEWTVLVNPANYQEIALYEQAYNQGKSYTNHMRFQIAKGLRDRVNNADNMKLEDLVAEAVLKVEEAWIRMIEARKEEEGAACDGYAAEEAGVEMPVPIPVFMFRRCPIRHT